MDSSPALQGSILERKKNWIKKKKNFFFLEERQDFLSFRKKFYKILSRIFMFTHLIFVFLIFFCGNISWTSGRGDSPVLTFTIIVKLEVNTNIHVYTGMHIFFWGRVGISNRPTRVW